MFDDKISFPFSIISCMMQVQAPTEFQGTVIGDLNKRKGLILNSETQGDDAIVDAQVCCKVTYGSLAPITDHAQASLHSAECQCHILLSNRNQASCNVSKN